MSVTRKIYAIAGCELTGKETEKFKDWRWTDEGDEYFNIQRVGKIQLFDDPMNGYHLFLGYILAVGDDDEFPTVSFSASEIVDFISMAELRRTLIHLSEIGVIEEIKDPEFKLIIFEEYY